MGIVEGFSRWPESGGNGSGKEVIKEVHVLNKTSRIVFDKRIHCKELSNGNISI